MNTFLHILKFLACDPEGQVVALGMAGVVASFLFSSRQTKEIRRD